MVLSRRIVFALACFISSQCFADPTFNFTTDHSYVGVSGGSITFTGAVSDWDGVVSYAEPESRWVWGDGSHGSYVPHVVLWSSESDTHVYSSPGTYTASYSIYLNRGQVDEVVYSVSHVVKVMGLVLTVTPACVGASPSTVTITDPLVDLRSLTCSIAYLHYGIGGPDSYINYAQGQIDIGHSYSYGGSNPTKYYPYLVVTVPEGTFTGPVSTVHLFRHPVADFEACLTTSPSTCSSSGVFVSVSSTVVFSNSSNLYGENPAAPLPYEWDFGDGGLVSHAASPVHSYSSSGYYTVSLDVDNGLAVSGSTDSKVVNNYIHVVDPSFTVNGESSGAQYLQEDVPVCLEDTTDDPSPMHSVSWWASQDGGSTYQALTVYSDVGCTGSYCTLGRGTWKLKEVLEDSGDPQMLGEVSYVYPDTVYSGWAYLVFGIVESPCEYIEFTNPVAFAYVPGRPELSSPVGADLVAEAYAPGSLSYRWDYYGDGSFISGSQHELFFYSKEGSFDVSVEVTASGVPDPDTATVPNMVARVRPEFNAHKSGGSSTDRMVKSSEEVIFSKSTGVSGEVVNTPSLTGYRVHVVDGGTDHYYPSDSTWYTQGQFDAGLVPVVLSSTGLHSSDLTALVTVNVPTCYGYTPTGAWVPQDFQLVRHYFSDDSAASSEVAGGGLYGVWVVDPSFNLLDTASSTGDLFGTYLYVPYSNEYRVFPLSPNTSDIDTNMYLDSSPTDYGVVTNPGLNYEWLADGSSVGSSTLSKTYFVGFDSEGDHPMSLSVSHASFGSVSLEGVVLVVDPSFDVYRTPTPGGGDSVQHLFSRRLATSWYSDGATEFNTVSLVNWTIPPAATYDIYFEWMVGQGGVFESIGTYTDYGSKTFTESDSAGFYDAQMDVHYVEDIVGGGGWEAVPLPTTKVDGVYVVDTAFDVVVGGVAGDIVQARAPFTVRKSITSDYSLTRPYEVEFSFDGGSVWVPALYADGFSVVGTLSTSGDKSLMIKISWEGEELSRTRVVHSIGVDFTTATIDERFGLTSATTTFLGSVDGDIPSGWTVPAGTDPEGWSWSFGTGGSKTGGTWQNPVVSYSIGGSYEVASTVSMTVSLVRDSDQFVLPVTVTKPAYVVLHKLAGITATPSSGIRALHVGYSITGDTPSYVDTNVSEWSWDLGDINGDGEEDIVSGAPSTSGGEEDFWTGDVKVPHMWYSVYQEDDDPPATVGGYVFSTDLSMTLIGWGGDTRTFTVSGPSCVRVTDYPQAEFTFDPYGPPYGAPLSVQFRDASFPGSSPITSWAWEFGDGGVSSSQNPSHTYSDGGVYTVSLSVATLMGTSIRVKSRYVACFSADFSADPSSGSAGLWVNFTDSTDIPSYDVHARTWAFGDGVTSTEQNPRHFYSESGSYSVVQTVQVVTKDDDGEDVVLTDAKSLPAYILVTESPRGGAVDVGSDSAFVSGCSFSGNRSEGEAGAVESCSVKQCVLDKNSFFLNQAQAGGAVQLENPEVSGSTPADIFNQVLSCKFVGNKASDYRGGALFSVDGDTSFLSNDVFLNNYAYSLGGAVASSGSSSLVSVGTTYFNNRTASRFTDRAESAIGTTTSGYTISGKFVLMGNPDLDGANPLSSDYKYRVEYVTDASLVSSAYFLMSGGALAGIRTSSYASASPITLSVEDSRVVTQALVGSHASDFVYLCVVNPAHPGGVAVGELYLPTSASVSEPEIVLYGNGVRTPYASGTFSSLGEVYPPGSGNRYLNLFEVVQGSMWSDPGYEAVDSQDGDLTGSVVVSFEGGSFDSSQVGTQLVTYTVSNSSDHEVVATRLVGIVAMPVSNVYPSFTATSDCVGSSPLSVDFKDTSETAGGVTIESRAWQFDVTYANVDHVVDTHARSTRQNPSWAYTGEGLYRVTLTVTASTGVPYTVSDYVAVVGTTPSSPGFSFSRALDSTYQDLGPLTVQFTDQSIPGSVGIQGWRWEFGDGSVDTTSNPQHVYAAPGNYQVVLYVSGSTVVDVDSDPSVTRSVYLTGKEGEGGSVFVNSGSGSIVANSILYGNASSEAYLSLVDSNTAALRVEYSDVGTGYVGDGNISSDPKFVGVTNPVSSSNSSMVDSLSLDLLPSSPCIDSGIVDVPVWDDLIISPPKYGAASPYEDILGRSRPEGVSSDMGAYEYTPASSGSVGQASGEVYVSDSSANLFRFDFGSGVATLVGNTGVVMQGMAFDPLGYLYGVSSGYLYLINPNNGAVKSVGSVVPGLTSIAFFADGSLYGSSTSFYRIDPSTAVCTLVGSLGGYSAVGGMVFDSLIRNEKSIVRGLVATADDHLLAVNKGTGISKVLGGLGFSGARALTIDSGLDLSGNPISRPRVIAFSNVDGCVYELVLDYPSVVGEGEGEGEASGDLEESRVVCSYRGKGISDVVSSASLYSIGAEGLGSYSYPIVFRDDSTAGNSTAKYWTWNFGDGGTSTEQSPSHVYVWPGDYKATLGVTTSIGQSVVSKDIELGKICTGGSFVLSVFKEGSGSVVVEAHDSQSLVTSLGPDTYKVGGRASLSAVPSDGWEFTSWKGNTKSKTVTPTYVDMNYQDQKVVACFSSTSVVPVVVEQYTLTMVKDPDSGDGKVTVKAVSPSTIHSTGYLKWLVSRVQDSKIFTAQPPQVTLTGVSGVTCAFVEFDSISGDVHGAGPVVPVSLEEDTTAVADFECSVGDWHTLTLVPTYVKVSQPVADPAVYVSSSNRDDQDLIPTVVGINGGQVIPGGSNLSYMIKGDVQISSAGHTYFSFLRYSGDLESSSSNAVLSAVANSVVNVEFSEIPPTVQGDFVTRGVTFRPSGNADLVEDDVTVIKGSSHAVGTHSATYSVYNTRGGGFGHYASYYISDVGSDLAATLRVTDTTSGLYAEETGVLAAYGVEFTRVLEDDNEVGGFSSVVHPFSRSRFAVNSDAKYIYVLGGNHYIDYTDDGGDVHQRMNDVWYTSNCQSWTRSKNHWDGQSGIWDAENFRRGGMSSALLYQPNPSPQPHTSIYVFGGQSDIAEFDGGARFKSYEVWMPHTNEPTNTASFWSSVEVPVGAPSPYDPGTYTSLVVGRLYTHGNPVVCGGLANIEFAGDTHRVYSFGGLIDEASVSTNNVWMYPATEIVGGRVDFSNEAYYLGSGSGDTWFTPRSHFGFVNFEQDGKQVIMVVGGMGMFYGILSTRSDVWYAYVDGTTNQSLEWVCSSLSGPFGAVRDPSMFWWNGVVWMTGGTSGRTDSTATPNSDIWYTTDLGVTWKQLHIIGSGNTYVARFGHRAVMCPAPVNASDTTNLYLLFGYGVVGGTHRTMNDAWRFALHD